MSAFSDKLLLRVSYCVFNSARPGGLKFGIENQAFTKEFVLVSTVSDQMSVLCLGLDRHCPTRCV